MPNDFDHGAVASWSDIIKELTVGIFTWIVLGLVVGVIAKVIMPGNDPGGFVITILLGVAGALLGGFLGTYFSVGDVTGFNLVSVALAVGGALVLLILYRLLVRR
jgi:uncharacterized membrane protein YeaQ/YmgE (transglycosylase-associated protein family)